MDLIRLGRPLAAVLLATGLAHLTTVEAYADTPTCDGRAATILGTAGQAVLGTAGDDVIVASDVDSIDAGAGDDTVCADNPAGQHPVDVDLGAGADTFAGTGFGLRVEDGDAEDLALGRPPSPDEIAGSNGARVVVGAPGWADDDVVTLGYGADDLILHGVPAGRYTAYRAHDSDNVLRLDDGGRHAWSIDAAAGTVSVDGDAPVVLAGFSELYLGSLTWSSLHYQGSAGYDSIHALGSRVAHGPVDLDMGAGPDWAYVDPGLSGSLDGGPGHQDQLAVVAKGRPVTHLRLAVGRGWRDDRGAHVQLSRWEEGTVSGMAAADVVGTPHFDYLDVGACRSTVRLGRGNDVLHFHRLGRCARLGPFAAYGGPGNDRLFGTGADDVLVGGPGRDLGCGGGGQDRIETERHRPCDYY